MKLRTSFVAAFLVVAASVSTAQAVVYFEDNFDSYAGQAALDAVWAPVGCTLSGVGTSSCTPPSPLPGNTLSTDFEGEGFGNSLLNVSPVGSPGSSDASQRNQIILTPAQTPPLLGIGDKVVFSYDFFDIDLFADATLSSPYRQNVHLQYRNPADGTFPLNSGNLIGLGMNNNQSGGESGGQFYMGRVLGYTSAATDPDGGPDEFDQGANNYFKLNDFSTGVGTGPGSRPTDVAAWHNFKVEISTDDGATQDYAFYVDGVLAERVSNVGALRQYNVIRVGSGVSSPLDAYYDNFLLEFIDGVAPPTNDADFNQDGAIDAADYPAWRKFNPLASGATQGTGDADSDGDNDGDDYDEWFTNYGDASPGGGGAGAVPEPASVVMLILGLAAVAGSRRRG